MGGDVILKVMGIPIDHPEMRKQIGDKFQKLKSGDEITVEVLRAGQVIELKNFFFPDMLIPAEPGE